MGKNDFFVLKLCVLNCLITMSSFISSSFTTIIKSDVSGHSGCIRSSSTRVSDSTHPYKTATQQDSTAVRNMRIRDKAAISVELKRQQIWKENPDAILPVGKTVRTLLILEQEH